ncbi:RNA polymerase sigma factor RpoD [Photobacterium aphoticum]|uniref:RNA polymerase sigma factor RpoD n=1 Tax=Photobacterium aphoticum TaxID=754436 RepID=A0A090QVX3_9GAMM|nr:RNA polymerase sigma factor RpoD [Photobacterium aphoticum]
MEDIIQMINDMGIKVVETAPDADDLMMTEDNADEDAIEAAAQALSSVESEIGRTTDPVRMYMREMGTVELLTREGEIDIAKRIEDGINQVQCSVAEYPTAIAHLLEQFDKVEADELRLTDIISGFVDPNEEESAAPTATHIGSELSEADLEDEDKDLEDDEDDDDSGEEEDSGIDPEVAREKFNELRLAYEKMALAIETNGRQNPTTEVAIEELSEIFKQFRLIPKQFDKLVGSLRDAMDKVRTNERLIMRMCVDNSKMPKKTFVNLFAGNEASSEWIDEA